MFKPHRNSYWLNANPKNPETFKLEANQICQLYQQAQELNINNIHTVSIDEMTGIQALEQAYPTDTMKPGKIEFPEFEYIRHGTLYREHHGMWPMEGYIILLLLQHAMKKILTVISLRL